MKCLLDGNPPPGATVESLDQRWQEFQLEARIMYGDKAHEVIDWKTCRPVYEKMRSELKKKLTTS